MDIILNQIAIWKPCESDNLNKRSVPIGSAYRTIDNPVYQKVNEPMYRYCKDYSKKFGTKLKFCLFVRTTLNDDKLVEKRLDAVAKTITKEQALEAIANSSINDFKYLPILITEVAA